MVQFRTQPRPSMIKMVLSWILTLPLLLPLTSSADSHEDHGHHEHHAPTLDDSRPQLVSGRSLYQIPSPWTDETGRMVQLNDLRGTVRVITMAYTHCQSACPILINDMQAIQQSLPRSMREKVQFGVFSLDSERDTPKVLQAYKLKRKLDSATWSLFSGTSDGVRTLAVALGIRYQKDERGEFAHSNVITLLDAEGKIVHQQVGLGQNPAAIAQAIQKLLK